MSGSTRMAAIVGQFAASTGTATGDPDDDIAAHWDRLRTAGIERPGLAFAEWVDLGLVGGVLPPLLANARDVRGLLTMLARFHPLWGDDTVTVEVLTRGWVGVTLRAPDGGGAHPDTLDAFFAIMAHALGQLTRPPLRPSRLSVTAHDPNGYERIAGTVRWGASADRLEFSPDDLATPIALADPSMNAVLETYASAAVARGDADWASRVRAAIGEVVDDERSLDAVAARLAHSPRTLQQRLQEQGTTFAALLDDERRLHALGLLANVALPVSSVAHRAGYRSAEGFSRAVRRWTGMSPRQWRAERVRHASGK